MYDQFYWGSNGVAANDGMAFIEAFLATKDPKYFEWAVQTLDYLIGRNALGYCFVTGFGSQSPLHPHHRPSSADGIAAPIPGFLVGGPNVVRDDATSCGITYPHLAPAQSWVDMECAYACNEVAINWNAPAAFLAGALEALYADSSNHLQIYWRDTLPPSIDSITVVGLACDHATLRWETKRGVSASIIYAQDSALSGAARAFSADSLHHGITLSGLSPATNYYFRIEAVDDYGIASETALRSFTTLSSNLAAGFSFDASALKPAEGRDLSVIFTGRAGIAATLTYGIGGENARSHEVFSGTNGVYTTTIPGSKMTPSGILFSITLADSSDTLTTATRSLTPIAAVACTSAIARVKAYNLVSFPFISATHRPFDVLSPLLGDSSTWRWFGYNGDSAKYTVGDGMTTGYAGWLYCSQKKSLVALGKAALPDTLYSIALKKGWNLIGSPFTFPVYWENTLVRSNNVVCRIFDKAAGQLVRRQLFGYADTTGDQLNNGAYYSNADLLQSTDTSRLIPWQGYWVYAEKSNVELLVNPQAQAPKPTALYKTRKTDNEWRVRFSASVNGTIDNGAIIGASAAALDGEDDLDSPKPPLVSNEVSVGLRKTNDPNTLYCADIMSAAACNHTWALEVNALKPGAEVVLSWQRSGTMKGFSYLIDPVAGLSMDLCGTDSYRIAFGPNEKRRILTLRQSPARDNSSRALPSMLALSIVSPNPFKNSMHINFSIPLGRSGAIGAGNVTLAVFDMLGRRVRMLVNGEKYPGYYSISWNGKDDVERRLRQGVYIVHLNAQGFSSSVTMRIVD
jgi:hypothetical protein